MLCFLPAAAADRGGSGVPRLDCVRLRPFAVVDEPEDVVFILEGLREGAPVVVLLVVGVRRPATPAGAPLLLGVDAADIMLEPSRVLSQSYP